MQAKKITKIFQALTDPTRREIMHLIILAGTALSISQVSNHFNMSRQGVTKHLNLLQEAGFVNLKSEGREKFCVPDLSPLTVIQDWMKQYDEFWDEKLQSLDRYLSSKKK